MTFESKACHEQAEAKQIVSDGIQSLHLKAAELKTTRGSDPKKAAIAATAHEETVVSRRWTAAWLKMKSAMNMCHLDESIGTVILDDLKAHRIARRLGLAVTGTPGILIQAKAAVQLPSVCDTIQKLQQRGMWIDDK